MGVCPTSCVTSSATPPAAGPARAGLTPALAAARGGARSAERRAARARLPRPEPVALVPVTSRSAHEDIARGGGGGAPRSLEMPRWTAGAPSDDS